MLPRPGLDTGGIFCFGDGLSTLSFITVAADVDDAPHTLRTEADTSSDARGRFTVQPRLEDLGIAFLTAPSLDVSLFRCDAAHGQRLRPEQGSAHLCLYRDVETFIE